MLRARREDGEPEALELGGAPVVVRSVALVRGNDARNAGLADGRNDLRVERGYALARVHDDDAHRGILDSERGLALRLLVERIVRDAAVEGDPARVDEHHLAALHLHLARHAVASDARLVENDGDALLRYAVEERALARVGPADERYDVHGFCLTFA